MRILPPNTGSRLREWELFTVTFFNYIFVTDEGRRVRGRFIRAVCWRTFFYFLAGLPPYIVLYLIHWVSFADTGRTVGYAVLLFNCALGLAILRSIRTYRARIQLYYASQFAGEQEADDELPVGHREIPQGPRKIILPPEVVGADSSDPKIQLAPPEEQPLGHADRTTLRCANCLRTCTLTAEAARKMTRCQYCGGDLVPL